MSQRERRLKSLASPFILHLKDGGSQAPILLLVEVDGEIHQQQQEYDRERDLVLIPGDLKILRVTDEQVIQNLQDVLDRIVEACKID